MILVTGGAGFIGANFVLDWLAQSDEGLINLDKLTYAGNRENLAALAGDPRHIFVHGDIGDRQLDEPPAVAAPAAGDHQLRCGVARRSLDPWSGRLHPDQYRRHFPPSGSRARLTGVVCTTTGKAGFFAFCMSRPTKSMARWPGRRRPSAKRIATSRTAPTRRARRRATIWLRAYHHTYGLPVLTTNCSNKLWSLTTFPRS
jgi:dTDP-glucose 4,6-dehydratase